MMDQRSRYMREILSQIDGAPRYFTGLLGLSADEKPWTRALINYGVRAGEMVAISHKRKYKRQRPSVLFPGLAVPFGPPAHPAFPSAHAVQSHLISRLLCRIDPPIKQRYDGQLDWLAKRIAKNRERAGMHYESDSVAGEAIGKYVDAQIVKPNLDQIKALGMTGVLSETQQAQVLAAHPTTMPELWNLIEQAKLEWV
jgi:hypothetical protein